MGTQIKKKIAILLALCFLLSITATAVAASPSTKDKGTNFLYIGDRGDNTVKQFDANSGIFIGNFVSSNSGGLYGPGGILFDKNGNLLVANQNVNQQGKSGEIFQYNGQTGVFEKALVPYTDQNAPFAPRGIILDDLKLYVASATSDDNDNPGYVRSYNAQDGTFLGDLPGVFQNVVFHPRGIVFGPDGYLYVSVMDVINGNGGHVLRFKSDGSFDKVFIADTGGVGKLNRPEGLVFGPDGNLYITSFRADTSDTDSIRIYSKDGVFLRKIDLDVAESAGGSRAFAQAILFGPKERLFVPITNTGEVRRYNVHAGTYDSFVKAGGELKAPFYLTFRKTNPKTLEYGNENNQNDNNQN
jgi:DNA-binding beta-propeller fold protein YncE